MEGSRPSKAEIALAADPFLADEARTIVESTQAVLDKVTAAGGDPFLMLESALQGCDPTGVGRALANRRDRAEQEDREWVRQRRIWEAWCLALPSERIRLLAAMENCVCACCWRGGQDLGAPA